MAEEQFVRLPLPLAVLPTAIQRFCDPKAPTPARVMAARGLVPVRGTEQILMLTQLASDEIEDVSEAARKTLAELPAAVRLPACEGALPSGALELLSDIYAKDLDALVRIVANAATHHSTIERLARGASEQLAERIAVNEMRLISAPGIIEALYKNANTRMSTADRLIEMAARHKLDLTGIPAFQDHLDALAGQLIPEPSDEPLPEDQSFAQAVANGADLGDEDVFEEDATGEQQVKKKFKPLTMQIAEMSKAQKIRFAMVGSKSARMILVRDNNRQVAMAAVSSPQATVQEGCEIAKARDVSEEVLRYVSNKKDWVKNSEVKHNLVFNPKCPTGISMRYLSHMRLDELKELARSRNIPAQIRSLASQYVNRKEKKK